MAKTLVEAAVLQRTAADVLARRAAARAAIGVPSDQLAQLRSHAAVAGDPEWPGRYCPRCWAVLPGSCSNGCADGHR